MTFHIHFIFPNCTLTSSEAIENEREKESVQFDHLYQLKVTISYSTVNFLFSQIIPSLLVLEWNYNHRFNALYILYCPECASVLQHFNKIMIKDCVLWKQCINKVGIAGCIWNVIVYKGVGFSSSKLNYVLWFMEVTNSQQMSSRYPTRLTTKLCV